MKSNLQHIFINSVPTPDGLDVRIMIRVKKAARRNFFEKIAIGSAASAVCAVALVFVGRETMTEMTASGFGDYFSLLFSSSGAVLSNWGDFGWTIIESAPITGLALCLGASGMLIGSVRWTGRAFGGFSRTPSSLAV